MSKTGGRNYNDMHRKNRTKSSLVCFCNSSLQWYCVFHRNKVWFRRTENCLVWRSKGSQSSLVQCW
jgi:hypothetical protein